MHISVISWQYFLIYSTANHHVSFEHVFGFDSHFSYIQWNWAGSSVTVHEALPPVWRGKYQDPPTDFGNFANFFLRSAPCGLTS